MSEWTLLIAHGRTADNYPFTRHDGNDRWKATADLAATMDDDERISAWESWKDHVCGYVDHIQAFGAARRLMDEYSPMIDNAVILTGNDTSNSASVEYYDYPDGFVTDRYREDYGEWMGEQLLCKINTQYDIMARDPFHHESYDGRRHTQSGNSRLNQEVTVNE